MTIKQEAHTWTGNLKEGNGTFNLPKGHYDGVHTRDTFFKR